MSRITSPADLNAARVQAFFSLLAAVEDTNLLHRGGAAGLAFSQQKARNFLLEGGIDQSDWSAQAEQIHAAFVARRLSPGGCADMLAITLFLDNLELDR
jgi:triphosphoribosyl-dephospho-CoA synthase